MCFIDINTILVLHSVGTAEAASNAETTMTQLVQEYTVRAQVRALCNKTGLKIDRTERVANSLGHLAAVVDQLNDLDHPVKVLPPCGWYLSLISKMHWACWNGRLIVISFS